MVRLHNCVMCGRERPTLAAGRVRHEASWWLCEWHCVVARYCGFTVWLSGDTTPMSMGQAERLRARYLGKE